MTDDAASTVSRVMSRIPDPAICPTVSVEEAAGWIGLGRSAGYEAVRRGELPVLRFGRALRVPTAMLRQLLGLPVSDELARVSDELAESSCDHPVTNGTDSLVSGHVFAPSGTDNRTPRADETTPGVDPGAVATLHVLPTDTTRVGTGAG